MTDHSVVGNVYACNKTIRQYGERHAGSWFHGDTWNPAAKPHVEGKVYSLEAALPVQSAGGDRHVVGNGLPVQVPTGKFPISRSDPAYPYDTNPNHIGKQIPNFGISAHPERADEPGCLPMGMIGVTVSGVAIYNALDDAGRDAAAHEVQDLCDCHPQGNWQYHDHHASLCIPGIDTNNVVGWALDGYPILGLKDADGHWMTNAARRPWLPRSSYASGLHTGRTATPASIITPLVAVRGWLLAGTYRAGAAGMDANR